MRGFHHILAVLILGAPVLAGLGRAVAFDATTAALAATGPELPLPSNAMETLVVAPSAQELPLMLRTIAPGVRAAIRSLQAVVFRLPAPVRTEQLFRSYAVVETQTGRAVAA